MTTTRKLAMSLYVVRGCPANWVVRDGDGAFWIIPPGDGAWERRQPFLPTKETELEAIPGHYLHMLGLPT